MIETIIMSIATLLVTLVLYYIFYPAVTAAYSSQVQMTSKILRKGADSQLPVLSIVIPAYNEQDRLPIMMRDAHKYIESRSKSLDRLCKHTGKSTIEWILVDDGSSDKTQKVYQDFVETVKNHTWKIVILHKNCGKGAAVQKGMLASQGAFALMVDADGATDFTCLDRLIDCHLDTKAPILLGSRRKLQKKQRSFVRGILMQAFHWFVVLFIGAADIQDTQCGFKMFAQETVQPLFGKLNLQRWAFDTELLFRAQRLQYRMEEVDVDWQEVEGSKLSTSALNLGLVAVGMLRDMVCVRLCYTFGIWKI